MRQEGATLLVVTLFTLIFLSLIMFLTSTMVLRGSRTSSDQRTTVTAQYAAETGRGYIEQRLWRTMSIFTGLTSGSTVTQTYLNVPSGALNSTLLGWVNQFCGNSAWTPTTINYAGATMNVSQCLVPPMPAGGYNATSTQFDIFNTFYTPNPAVSATSPNYPFPAGTPDTVAGRRAYWNQLLGTGVTMTLTTGTQSVDALYSLTPTRAVQISPANFRLYLRPNNLRSVGRTPGGQRLLKANATSNSEFYVRIYRPSYSEKVLLTNHHKNKAGSTVVFSTQQFDGPVHTNENFAFQTGSSAQFTDVTSTGCDFTSITSNTCSSITPKMIIGGATYTSNLAANLASQTSVGISGTSNWAAPYVAMPTNNQDQQGAANAGGLVLDSTISSVSLKATDASGNLPTAYNSALRQWTPTPTYQYITTTNSSNVVTNYRYGSDKILYQQIAGVWTPIKNDFNGVVYAPSAINVSGPGRNTAGQARPALAPFAGMTLAGTANINITNDLTYSDVPCKSTEACYTSKPMPQNILGIFTQAGDITIGTTAPNDVNIHASLMTSTGEVKVTDHNLGSPRGNVNLIGGLIENYYGAFGTVNGNTPATGYGRNFTFDQRMGSAIGMMPPYFALTQNWTVTGSNQTATTGSTSLLNTFWNQDKQ